METQIHRRVAQLQMPKLQKGEETYEWILKLCPNLMTPSQFLPDKISLEPKDVWFDTGVLEPFTMINVNIDRQEKLFHLKLHIPKMIISNKLKTIILLVKTTSIKFLEGEEIVEEFNYPDPQRPLGLERSFLMDVSINAEEFWKDETDAISVSFVVEFETAMSPVFKKMFESGLKEEQEGRILILDMQPQTLKILLDGIYSGKIDSSQITKIDELVNLFKASHRYCIDPLRDWTSSQIGFKVNAGNALDIYRLGTVYENEGLQNTGLVVIKNIFHDPSVLRDFMNENPEHFKLIHELLINQ